MIKRILPELLATGTFCTLESACRDAVKNTDGFSHPCKQSGKNQICKQTSSPSSSYCVDCNEDGDCAGGLKCKSSDNTCVQCTQNSHCTGTYKRCKTSTTVCVSCLNDSDCKAYKCKTSNNMKKLLQMNWNKVVQVRCGGGSSATTPLAAVVVRQKL